MSTLSRFLAFVWREVVLAPLSLVMPLCCPVCGRELGRGQRYVCTSCRLDVPLTRFSRDVDNPMALRVRSIRPEIEHATALMFYIQGGLWRSVIHRMKYQSEWRHGVEFGKWLGSELSSAPLYQDVDCVVAVPLHPIKQLCRGYNQSEYLAEGVAKAMGVEHLRGCIYRKRHNAAQVTRQRDERWSNVEDLFGVKRANRLEGRSILLVDDVFTTGATILSCAEAILDAVPNCRVWIATLAASTREFGYGQN